MKRLVVLFLIASAFITSAKAEVLNNNREFSLKSTMLSDINTVRNIFKVQYAPILWKEKYFGWNLDGEADAIYNIVSSQPTTAIKDYQLLLKQFVASTHDYHVDITFYSTERATIPLVIKSAEGKYVLAYIPREFLSEKTFPFKVGDEVVEFGGKPTKDVVEDVRKELMFGTAPTDYALAELYITRRIGAIRAKVPRGPITLKIKRHDTGAEVEHELIWNYKPEQIRFPTRFQDEVRIESLARGFNREESVSRRLIRQYSNMSARNRIKGLDAEKETAVNPFQIGGKTSFLPALGKKVWAAEEANEFDAYIFEQEGKQIGYVRIPSYSPDDEDKAVADFKTIVKKFQESTDALVIDQVNNPGGSVFYLYALASLLTDRPLLAPPHRTTITPEFVMDAVKTIDELKDVTTEEQAVEVMGETISGYPVSLQLAQFMAEFSQFVKDQWEQGKTLTDYNYLWAVNKINPHTETHYTKPILLLTNNLDFSGGDFFPAILQDNTRATVFGTRTAGAGGYILDFTYPNIFGVESISVTGSIAKRVDQNPIENLGVTPDQEYVLTLNDYRDSFKEYSDAIKKKIVKMAGGTQ